MEKDALLAESVAEKFLRYVRIDTRSSRESATRPSTPGQRVLAEMLRRELAALGLADARLDEHGFVLATLAGNRPGAPAVGFLAHLDTFEGVPAAGVKPIVHRAYDGGPLDLPGGLRIAPEDTPALSRLVGHDLITSDGRTLLGVDDKAGIAEIMAFLCRLIAEPERPRGEIKIAFTPDEEIGKGVDRFDVQGFGACCAYTVDDGEAGQFEQENFNAVNLEVTITGISSHTGTARGNMINAINAAGEMIVGIPANMRPETTDDRLGFLHVEKIEGHPERVTMFWLIRDFAEEGLAQKRRLVEMSLRHLKAKYPGLKTGTKILACYWNMLPGLQEDPRTVAHALEAYRRAGMEPAVKAIRGGTDGARLTQMGLPTPNLFTGGLNFHSRKELVSVQWMEKAVDVLLQLAGLWAEENR